MSMSSASSLSYGPQAYTVAKYEANHSCPHLQPLHVTLPFKLSQ